MRYVSSRGGAKASASKAIFSGAARDGGLYLPIALPSFDAGDFDEAADLAAFASSFLKFFFLGDVLESELQGICRRAFGFSAPLVGPDRSDVGLHVLELFHGPTGAFKDFGARFLMACFDAIGVGEPPLTVLAATSGDTGGAVGSAAEARRSVRAFLLFPKGRVSRFQELQLSCWSDPVRSLEVDGDFDDCQRLVKAAFADRDLRKVHRLTSANSINIGRLLPQAAYLAHAALKLFAKTGKKPGFIIPTGNLGHGYAALLARATGIPIGPVVFSTNSNRTLKDWEGHGTFEPRPSVATLANAMDVGNPSNFERLIALPEELRKVRIELVDDDEIKARIKSDCARLGYVWCPHSATAAEAYARLPSKERSDRPWILAATAHPYKFREIVEPLIGYQIEAPPALAAILERPTRKLAIPGTLEALAAALRQEEAVSQDRRC